MYEKTDTLFQFKYVVLLFICISQIRHGIYAVLEPDNNVEMPLIGNDDVPLVAKLDTTKLNKAIKNYINKTSKGIIYQELNQFTENLQAKILSNKYQRDCEDVKSTESGIYRIYPVDVRGFKVYCDMMTRGGGWTVFQKRVDGSVNFYRNWNDYKNGFGDLGGEFWLGNTRIHDLTSRDEYELLIQMEDFEGEKRFARYKTFYVGDPVSKYKLTVGEYDGTAGDAMTYHNQHAFSAKDRDTSSNCVSQFKGGWWYYNCHLSNLNGLYLNGSHNSFADGVNWEKWRGYKYSMKRTIMMIRRRR